MMNINNSNSGLALIVADVDVDKINTYMNELLAHHVARLSEDGEKAIYLHELIDVLAKHLCPDEIMEKEQPLTADMSKGIIIGYLAAAMH